MSAPGQDAKALRVLQTLANLQREREVIRAALEHRVAYYLWMQNDGEVANGGRDRGAAALDAKMQETGNALDDALTGLFGKHWEP